MQLTSYVLSWMIVRVRSERGQDLIEYALLGGLIAAALLGIGAVLGLGVTSMGDHIKACIDFDSVTTCDISLP